MLIRRYFAPAVSDILLTAVPLHPPHPKTHKDKRPFLMLQSRKQKVADGQKG